MTGRIEHDIVRDRKGSGVGETVCEWVLYGGRRQTIEVNLHRTWVASKIFQFVRL